VFGLIVSAFATSRTAGSFSFSAISPPIISSAILASSCSDKGMPPCNLKENILYRLSS